MKKHKKIQAYERDKIAFLLASKTSLRGISRTLDRSFSSIRDEVKRNSHGGIYTAIKAEELSQKETRKAVSLIHSRVLRFTVMSTRN